MKKLPSRSLTLLTSSSPATHLPFSKATAAGWWSVGVQACIYAKAWLALQLPYPEEFVVALRCTGGGLEFRWWRWLRHQHCPARELPDQPNGQPQRGSHIRAVTPCCHDAARQATRPLRELACNGNRQPSRVKVEIKSFTNNVLQMAQNRVVFIATRHPRDQRGATKVGMCTYHH